MSAGASGRPLDQLPKAHLHLHLECAIRPATLEELAKRARLILPDVSAGVDVSVWEGPMIEAARASVQSFHDLTRVVSEIAEDAALDGAVWIEIGVQLDDLRHIDAPAVIVDRLVGAAETASTASGVGIGWVVNADRAREPRLAVELALVAAARAKDGVVGFGLTDIEVVAVDAYAGAFAVAGGGGLLRVPHAGASAGPAAVRTAAVALDADRIQNGSRAAEDPGLLRRLAERGTCLDLCPTADVRRSVVPDITAHPLPRLVAAGVPCSINAGSPLLFGVNLLAEYELCRNCLGFDDATLAACARASIEHSGAPASIKENALLGIEAWLGGGAEQPPADATAQSPPPDDGDGQPPADVNGAVGGRAPA